MQGRGQVDLPGRSADGVPVSEYRLVPVAEQVSAVGVAVDRPGRELEGRLPVARPGWPLHRFGVVDPLVRGPAEGLDRPGVPLRAAGPGPVVTAAPN